jgi:sulfatase modifying factor 1
MLEARAMALRTVFLFAVAALVGCQGGRSDSGATITPCQRCGGACVNQQVDPSNCGGCGLTCPVGQVCQNGTCGNPPSCAPGGQGMTNCGPGGRETESCCTSLEVTGGTFYRTYDPVITVDAAPPMTTPELVLVADGGEPVGEADPATVSTFRLDKYEITVGRFRQFVTVWKGGWTPFEGSGKHVHLNHGQGLVPGGYGYAFIIIGDSYFNRIDYEPGWSTLDNVNIAPTDANLANDLCDGRQTWTPSASNNENLPINCVNWWEAYAFCIWDGGFLPSAAEWEYAAAGGSQQREYPWGATDPGTDNQYAIYGCFYPPGLAGTPDSALFTCPSPVALGTVNFAPVGTAVLGVGRWGQLDLAGNVTEWNLDYSHAYENPCTDCAELSWHDTKRYAGGGYDGSTWELVPSVIANYAQRVRTDVGGFRCARTP